MTANRRRSAGTDVLISGAGPTGLMLANVLARQGVKFRVIDKKAGPTDQSKALVVHARTLELWDRLGLAEPAVERGQKLKAVYPLVNGMFPKGDLPLLDLERGGEGLTPYPFGLVLEQSKTERLLLDGLEDFGDLVEWETELLGMEEAGGGVRAVVRRPDGSDEEILARWVVGADGASSWVRRHLDLGFEGSTYEQAFFLADVEMEWSLGRERYYLDFVREGMYGFFPMPGKDRFRLIGSVPEELAGKSEITARDVQEVLDRHSGLKTRVKDVRWTSVYRIHRRMTERFRAGRVFLAGDAAHVHSPSGGQGMNTGLQDAYNLAWKLALVARGEAREEVLDSYEAERMPAARAILNGTDRGFEFQSTSKPWLQRARLLLVPYLPGIMARSGLGRPLFRLISQVWTRYRNSPALADPARGKGPQPGDRAPFGLLEDGTSLYDLLRGTGHHLLIFEGTQFGTSLEATRSRLEALLGRYGFPAEVRAIGARNRRLHELYGARETVVFLVRPDGHVAYRGKAEDIGALGRYLDRLVAPRKRAKPREPERLAG